VGLYGHEPTTLLALSQQAELKRIQGQYRQAILLFRQLLQLATEAQQPGQWLTTGLAHGMLGFLLYEANELAEAELHARQGIKLGQQGVGVGALFASYLGLAKVLLAQGKLTTAAEVIEAMKQLAQSLDSGVFLSLAALLRVEVGLAQGDWAAVAQWQQASGLQVDDAFDHSSALVYNRLACILVAQGQVDAALTLLSRLIALCEATHWVEGLIKTLAVQAIACLTQHQLEPALASLQRALMLAEPERYIRTFVDLGPPMRLLMLDLRLRINRQSPEQTQRRLLTYIDQLLAVFDPAPPTIADTPSPRSPTIHDPKSLTSGGIIQNLVEPLTRRELEVLHLLAQGLSNQEIADQLIVAKSTLRTHINNLYGKLAVENRLQAVIRSQELGLL